MLRLLSLDTKEARVAVRECVVPSWLERRMELSSRLALALMTHKEGSHQKQVQWSLSNSKVAQMLEFQGFLFS
jgi:hypothetical protein